MKLRFLNIVLSVLVVGFVAGCGSSGGGGGGSEDAVTPNGDSQYTAGASESGTFETTVDGVSKNFISIRRDAHGLIDNSASYTQESGRIKIKAMAVTGLDILSANLGYFYLAFDYPSGGVTTGNIDGHEIGYQASKGADIYTISTDGVNSHDFTINVKKASKNGDTIHIEGSVSTLVYEGYGSNITSKSLSATFNFDADLEQDY